MLRKSASEATDLVINRSQEKESDFILSTLQVKGLLPWQSKVIPDSLCLSGAKKVKYILSGKKENTPSKPSAGKFSLLKSAVPKQYRPFITIIAGIITASVVGFCWFCP